MRKFFEDEISYYQRTDAQDYRYAMQWAAISNSEFEDSFALTTWKEFQNRIAIRSAQTREMLFDLIDKK